MSKLKYLPHLAFATAALMIAVLGWLLYEASAKSQESVRWTSHTLEVIRSIGKVSDRLNQAELAQRSYLLSGSAAFLSERDQALAKLGDDSKNLQKLTFDHPDQQRRIARFGELVAARVEIMHENSRRRQNEAVEAVYDTFEAGAIVQGVNAQILVLVGPIQHDELRLLQVMRDGLQNRYQSSLVGLAVVVLVSMAVLGYHITDRKQAEAVLLKTGALQSAILNSANFSSIATDAKGVIQIFNVGAERMLGYTAADVVNTITPADISDPQEVIARAEALSVELVTPIAPGFEALVFKASRGIEDIYELTYIHKDGSRFPAVVSVTALRDAQDAIIGYLLIGTDNTARKRAEAEKEKLQEDSRMKSEFLAHMSHELRTPLNGIIGFAEFLFDGKPGVLNAKQREFLLDILNSGKHLLQLINDVLDLAKVEAGKMELSLEKFTLAHAIGEVCAVAKPMAQKKDIQVNVKVAPELGSVTLDQQKFKQVLYNLISNGIKFSDDGGVVEISAAPLDPHRFKLSVKDTGIGIQPEDIKRLFREFEQLESGASRRYEGTGLGLALTRKLVELQGGVITVESKFGQGSAFSVVLPLIPSEGRA